MNIKVLLFLLAFLVLPGLCEAQYNEDLPYTVNNGVIYCELGIPEVPRWFADSRLAFRFDERGIAQVDYYSAVPEQNLSTLFLRQLWDGFRYFLEQDNKTFKPEYANSHVWPFGIESEWNFQGTIMKHRAMAIDESIIIQLVGLNNFISLALMYHESLKITNHAGAMRAKTSNYWVWGWDGMTSNDATAYWGDVDHIRNMLLFYEATADSLKGIGHAFDFRYEANQYQRLAGPGNVYFSSSIVLFEYA